ncbi:hypothetical protein AB0J66_43190 [Actinoplanes sp. NPDC049598]|uniref:hypothetical protein n=2 Tax=unclassified Actinoplanes TaxID=2626549 RepID=UPI0034216F8A
MAHDERLMCTAETKLRELGYIPMPRFNRANNNTDDTFVGVQWVKRDEALAILDLMTKNGGQE